MRQRRTAISTLRNLMRSAPNGRSLLVVCLLLALYLPQAVGAAIDAQPLRRNADAARLIPAIMGEAVGVAEPVERAHSHLEKTNAPAALLPGNPAVHATRGLLFAATATLACASSDAGQRSLPIRAPPALPVR